MKGEDASPAAPAAPAPATATAVLVDPELGSAAPAAAFVAAESGPTGPEVESLNLLLKRLAEGETEREVETETEAETEGEAEAGGGAQRGAE